MGKELVVKTKLGEYVVRIDLMYTKTDEWVRKEDNIIVIGITDYAQKKLKHIVNVELPEKGREVKAGDVVATLESVKTVADVYTPVSGVVEEVNEKLLDSPDLINNDPYGEGWIVKIRATEEPKELLTPEEYAKKIEKEE